MKAVYKFHYDCGRMGELTGLFVAEKEQIEWLKQTNLDIYFGEVLGKHSEVYGPLEEKDISLVSDDEAVIKVITEHDLTNGFNPLDYGFLDCELVPDYDGGPSIEVYNKLFQPPVV